MKVFCVIRSNVDERIQEVAEIISEMRDPMQVKGDENKEGVLALSVHNTPKGPTKAEKAAMEEANRRKKVQIAKVKVQLNELKNDQDEAIANKDFVRAQQLNLEMDQLKGEQERLQEELTEAAAMAAMPPPAAVAQPAEVDNQLRLSQDEDEEEEGAKPDDPLVVHKCLEIIFQLMQDRAVELNPTLRTLLDELVLPAIQNLQAPIRNSVGSIPIS